MAKKTIKIADKPTLDEVRELLENKDYGLSTLKSLIDSGDNSDKLNTLLNAKFSNYIDVSLEDSSQSGVDNNKGSLPYNFYGGHAVVYENTIHILGSSYSPKRHYKISGEWKFVSDLPVAPFCAVVYKNEIHMLGGSTGYTDHYKWDGTEWTLVQRLPYNFKQGSAVVYNNAIHILGGSASNTAAHYKWDGNSWSKVSTLPYSFYNGSAVVTEGRIHILGGTGGNTKHYKWDGSSWSKVIDTLPYPFNRGCAVVYSNNIHILGSDCNGNYTNYYTIIKHVERPIANDSVVPYFFGGDEIYCNFHLYPKTNCKLVDGHLVVQNDGYVSFSVESGSLESVRCTIRQKI